MSATVPPCGHDWARMEHGQAALELTRTGLAVLPLNPYGKNPHDLLPPAPPGRGGVHLASADPRLVRRWWQQDPKANIGVPTGTVNRLAVVDLDVKHGDDGPGNFARFLAGNGLWLPPAPWDETTSGGSHICLRTPPGVRVPDRLGILPGVDVKGDGGYIVVPPSALMVHVDGHDVRHGGGEVAVSYRWASGWCLCQAPVAPPWLFRWLATAPATGRSNGSGGGDIDAGQIGQYKLRGIKLGRQWDTLGQLAWLRSRDLTTADLADELWEVMQASPQDPRSPRGPWTRSHAWSIAARAAESRTRADAEEAGEWQRWGPGLMRWCEQHATPQGRPARKPGQRKPGVRR